MLESFIQSNSLNAKILPCVARGSLVKCQLFSPGSFDVLGVFFARDRIDEKKLCAAVSAESIVLVEAEEAKEITGYKASFLPPVSIYGVKVVVDSKVMNAERVRCLLEKDKTLEISPAEIVQANDDAIVAGITI